MKLISSFMVCPCSFDWKLLVDFLKALLSFPVVVLVLGLIILSRYREEIRKKISGLTKASAVGVEALFLAEEAAITEGATSSTSDTIKVADGHALPGANLRLISYIVSSFRMLVEKTQAELIKEGKYKWDLDALLSHKQEWVDGIFKMHPELVQHFGRDAMSAAIANRVMVYTNFAKAYSKKQPDSE